jgi:hypothetical protein
MSTLTFRQKVGNEMSDFYDRRDVRRQIAKNYREADAERKERRAKIASGEITPEDLAAEAELKAKIGSNPQTSPEILRALAATPQEGRNAAVAQPLASRVAEAVEATTEFSGQDSHNSRAVGR